MGTSIETIMRKHGLLISMWGGGGGGGGGKGCHGFRNNES